MTTITIFHILKRALRKPPHVIAKRIATEIKTKLERYTYPYIRNKFTLKNLLKLTGNDNLNQLWNALAQRPYPAYFDAIEDTEYEKYCPENKSHIIKQAERAIIHQVNLLGSDDINLGKTILWNKDYKSGFSWPNQYCFDIDYNNLDLSSDVKFPWELSRLQWLIPVGQAYLITQDEKYAAAAKQILNQWIENNPYMYSVNWSCTMEVALRILSWTWLFYVFNKSTIWQDDEFRTKFLTTLFLHADFTAKHLEYSDINGNHYTANAAGLVFAGLFFANGKRANQWQKLGWKILNTELPKQVFADGVDFEASTAYHRLVLELFFLPALYRQKLGLDVTPTYRDYLIKMAHFTAAYSRSDGSVPLWGDADDGRALPLGDQNINDHRYLCGLIGFTFNDKQLIQHFSGSKSEIYWLLGPQVLSQLANKNIGLTYCAFPQGGFYIMRNDLDHVFIDCGPIGLAGRGGHGHNDCLSFEAVLEGEHLITDCGAYLYTASYQERNNFRSTTYHNTPQIDSEEMNRFIRWDYLWNLHNDAKPILHQWLPGNEHDIFSGSHTGYLRLKDPVTLKRTIALHHKQHLLTIEDEFISQKDHKIAIPFHLAPKVSIKNKISCNQLLLESNNKQFTLTWDNEQHWEMTIEAVRISPSYGIVVPTTKLVLRHQAANAKIKISIQSSAV